MATAMTKHCPPNQVSAGLPEGLTPAPVSLLWTAYPQQSPDRPLRDLNTRAFDNQTEIVMAKVTLKNVFKIYPGDKGADVTAVTDFNLDIEDREFVVFVGPSGCGKSTTLRMIAGLEEASDGSILIGDRVVNDVPPKDRNIAMVFQNYALYPHMNVYKNMAFGLKLRRTPKPEI